MSELQKFELEGVYYGTAMLNIVRETSRCDMIWLLRWIGVDLHNPSSLIVQRPRDIKLVVPFLLGVKVSLEDMALELFIPWLSSFVTLNPFYEGNEKEVTYVKKTILWDEIAFLTHSNDKFIVHIHLC